MRAQATRAGGKYVAAERGAVETEVESESIAVPSAKPTAPLFEFLRPASIVALWSVYNELPKAR